jgi:hypothetical protein
MITAGRPVNNVASCIGTAVDLRAGCCGTAARLCTLLTWCSHLFSAVQFVPLYAPLPLLHPAPKLTVRSRSLSLTAPAVKPAELLQRSVRT